MECTCTCSNFLCFTWKSSTRVIVYHVVEEKTCWWENAQTANRCVCSPFVIVAKDERLTYKEGRLILTRFRGFRPWPGDCGEPLLPSGHTNNRRERGEGDLPASLPWTNFQWSALPYTARIPTSFWCHGLRAKSLTHGPSGTVSPNHGASDEEKREKETERLQSRRTQLPEWIVIHCMKESRKTHPKPSGSFLTVGRLRLSITAF